MIIWFTLTMLIASGLIMYLCSQFEKHAWAIFLAGGVILGVVFCVNMYSVANKLIGDSEKYQFYIDGQKHEMFYDNESERYFKITVANNWNPIDWLDREYIETENVENFLAAYEEYESHYEKLKEFKEGVFYD